jgi:hypothetical protein
MHERELIAIAVFRIGETSKQLRLLAMQAESTALREWLLLTAGELAGRAARATAILAAAEDDGDADAALPAAPPPGEPAC